MGQKIQENIVSDWGKNSDHLTIYTPEIILPKISHSAWMNLDEYTFNFLKPSQAKIWTLVFVHEALFLTYQNTWPLWGHNSSPQYISDLLIKSLGANEQPLKKITKKWQEYWGSNMFIPPKTPLFGPKIKKNIFLKVHLILSRKLVLNVQIDPRGPQELIF